MRMPRRWAMVVAVAALVVAALPAIGARALAPRQLIPCAQTSIGDRTVNAPVVVNTTTLTFGVEPIGQDVGGVAVFTFDDLIVSSSGTVNVVGSRPLALLARDDIIVESGDRSS